MTRSVSVVVGVVLAGVLVAGCGGDPEPEFTEGSPSAASSVSEPAPSESFDPTEETAEEFIRRWVRASNEIQKTGRVRSYRRLVTKNCGPCHKFADRVRAIHRNGGFIETAGLTIVAIVHDGANQWTVSYRAAPTEFRVATGKPIEKLAGGTYDNLVFLRETKHGWRVEHFSRVGR